MGIYNLLYIMFAAILGAKGHLLGVNFIGGYTTFLILTQFVHYYKYITTYYWRKVNFSHFKRDVLFFKSVALTNLAYMVLRPYWKVISAEGLAGLSSDLSLNLPGISMIAAGYFVSISATAALGVDGTYFGIELGVVEADYGFVKSFPYNCIPHPMILSQVVALIGIHTFPGVGGTVPWLVPTHVALYFLHMAQEIYDVWDGTPWYKKGENKVE
ncbi:hypothetical protein TrRE_jg1901 [Triparma retinervis]|uniref:phosphatidyl-N-methylethanolamine N-methyltransferase n=1 Tax=Triparma retinervis TaxID=2557542 RepID=A0A9W7KV26_9STRA|nr:hypothetical protein TrRE_jg1901 [Triparma retinervis]